MKKFSFRLERVLLLRRQLEREARVRVREANGWREKAAEEVELRRRAERDFAGQFRNCFDEGRFPTVRLESYRAYFERLGKDTTRAQETLSRVTKVWEERREGLIRATKAMKVLERLRDSQREMYEKGVMHKEQATADDVVAGRKAKQDLRRL